MRMPAFIQENLLLILLIVGAILSFLGSFIALVADKKPVSVLAVLLVVGFVVGISQQLYSHSQKKEAARRATAKEQIEAAAQQARDNVINEINWTVQKTEITVDAIADKLLNANISDLGTELVSIQSSGQANFEESVAFAKGAPGMWPDFFEWLKSVSSASIAPSLSLRVNAGHHYDGGLLLAYLLTGPATGDDIFQVVENYDLWHSFSAEEIFLKSYAQNQQHLQMVLIYSGDSPIPVAYASAREFSQELMVYHRLGQHQQLDDLFNTANPKTLDKLLAAFSSLQTDVFATAKPAELVRKMIDNKLGEAVSADAGTTYLVRLAKMIQLAAAP